MFKRKQRTEPWIYILYSRAVEHESNKKIYTHRSTAKLGLKVKQRYGEKNTQNKYKIQ